MIFYHVLRRVARIALGWYYADVVIHGREHLPAKGPLLLVANHPNALVDAMAVAVSMPRRVLLTAKATLFEHPVLAAGLRAVGVVPLRRSKDERSDAGTTPAAARNADAFQAVTSALARGSAVLVFPEGISHDAPALAPLRTGAARMALMANRSGVAALRVIAVGLTYEEKETPRSRVLIRFGEALDLEDWLTGHGDDPTALTAAIEARLRGVTLNFTTEERAHRVVRLARMLDAIAGDVPPLDHPRALAPEAELARRIDVATEALAGASEHLAHRADVLIAATDAFERGLAERRVAMAELRVSPRGHHGARFVLRESLLLALALPVALVDRLAHDIPVRLARVVARRSLATDPSRDQPAMRTILFAAGLLLAWYLVLGVALAHWFGWTIALLVLATMALSASAELSVRDRLTRAAPRARTYLALRADPAFRATALAEADRLLDEARAIERALVSRDAPARPVRSLG